MTLENSTGDCFVHLGLRDNFRNVSPFLGFSEVLFFFLKYLEIPTQYSGQSLTHKEIHSWLREAKRVGEAAAGLMGEVGLLVCLSDGSQVRQGSDSAERIMQSCQEYCIHGLLGLWPSNCPSLCGFFWETTEFSSTTWQIPEREGQQL